MLWLKEPFGVTYYTFLNKNNFIRTKALILGKKIKIRAS